MAQDPDLSELARRYLDLWEEHLAELGDTEDMSRAWSQYWARMMSMAGPGFGPGAELSNEKTGDDEKRTATRPQGGEWGPGPQPHRPDPAAAPSDPRLDELDELVRRIADLEARMAGLESNAKSAAKPKPRARGKPKTASKKG